MTTAALAHLRTLTGRPDAVFRDGQEEAIAALVDERRRVLVVQRTGWGKSAVYFVATRLLRDAGAGPTLLVSPLLALMRNQIAAAERMGIRARTLNSTNRDEWADVADEIEADAVDLLLVSPERLANPQFQDEVLPVVSPRSGLLVVDEAHCISDWGHDFRPDYRRIAEVLQRLPAGVPVLCCTATANDRVVADIQAQLGADLATFRGPLGRDSLALHVIDLPSAADRLVWLAHTVPQLPGTGIVYCLTVRDTAEVAAWLCSRGIEAVAYTGGTDPVDRLVVEDKLLGNQVKVVVATSALGMGFDKPDLGFVIHFQAPGSAVAYYQQVGRAGRQIDESTGVLLRGTEDRDIQDWFIRTAFPSREDAEQAIAFLGDADERGRSVREIEQEVNLRRTRLEVLLKVLEVEGAVERRGGRYHRTAEPWSYDDDRTEAVTALRRAEQQQMTDYAETDGCRMVFLRNLLDDAHTERCGSCDRCTGDDLSFDIDDEERAAARTFLRSRPLTVDPRKQWPYPVGGSTRIRPDEQLQPGRALSRWRDDGWGRTVARGREQGRFADALVTAAVELVQAWNPTPAPAAVCWVPSWRSPALVAGLAAEVAAALGLPAVDAVHRTAERPPQAAMENSAQQAANVLGAFAVDGGALHDAGVGGCPVLLIDDTVDSRWTLTAVGRQLAAAGAGPVYPLVLAEGGDSS
jgi:ATP-dependent DNA helicase RecQ